MVECIERYSGSSYRYKSNTLASKSFTLASSDTSLQKNVTFTIDEKEVVTVTISKTGSADPGLKLDRCYAG